MLGRAFVISYLGFHHPDTSALILFACQHTCCSTIDTLFFFFLAFVINFTFLRVTSFLLTFQITRIMKTVLLNSWTGAPLP